jgi:hypothetical protein
MKKLLKYFASLRLGRRVGEEGKFLTKTKTLEVAPSRVFVCFADLNSCYLHHTDSIYIKKQFVKIFQGFQKSLSLFLPKKKIEKNSEIQKSPLSSSKEKREREMMSHFRKNRRERNGGKREDFFWLKQEKPGVAAPGFSFALIEIGIISSACRLYVHEKPVCQVFLKNSSKCRLSPAGRR